MLSAYKCSSLKVFLYLGFYFLLSSQLFSQEGSVYNTSESSQSNDVMTSDAVASNESEPFENNQVDEQNLQSIEHDSIQNDDIILHPALSEKTGALIDATNLKIKIKSVEYNITGLTQKFPLQLAVPIDREVIFETEKKFLEYLSEIQQKLNNLRTLESSTLEYEYVEVKEDVVFAKITINTKDTWNIIALPFPKYDSNVGFVAKIKAKDYNFLGSMQVLNLDLSYVLDNSNKSYGGIAASFSYPFRMGPLSAKYTFDTTLSIEKDNVGFDLNNTLEASYSLKFISFNFGFYQGFNLNKPRVDDEKEKKGDENEYEEDELQNKPIHDLYFLYTKFFLYTPITIYNIPNIGKITYTPYIAFKGNWAFKELNEKSKKGIVGTFHHALYLSKINWRGNFRHGFSTSIENSYSYNFFLKEKPKIELSATLKGYYSFWEYIGLYSKLDAFYIFSQRTSQRAGENLRGILNNRIETDTAISLNIDIPIKIYNFDFKKITGVEWTRYVGFELFISLFLDMALVHDMVSGRYFHPKDGWYAGGIEAILYLHKMRSIYFRISVGFDLTELKNVAGINKIGGIAKRDGKPISEIFIGIGLHY